MGGLVALMVFGIIYLIDFNEKRRVKALYDQKIHEASTVGDYELAGRYIELKSRYR